MTQVALAETDLTLTMPAQGKMAELMGQVDENIHGVRVFATPGGCSGVSFGMTFTDQLNDDDKVREYEGVRVIVDSGTLEYIRGVEIDFVDGGDGDGSADDDDNDDDDDETDVVSKSYCLLSANTFGLW